MHVRGSFALLAALLLCGLVLAGAKYARQALTTTAALPAEPPPPALPAIFDVLEMRPVTIADADRAFLATLRTEFDARLDDPRAQLQMLERLLAHQAARYPESDGDLLLRFLKEAFPLRASELFNTSLKLARYRDWLGAHRHTLRTLPPEQRRTLLWNARRQAFGDDADRIWAAELRHVVPIGSAIAAP